MIWDLQFQSILSLSSDVPVEARVEQDGSRWSLNTLHKNADASQVRNLISAINQLTYVIFIAERRKGSLYRIL